MVVTCPQGYGGVRIVVKDKGQKKKNKTVYTNHTSPYTETKREGITDLYNLEIGKNKVIK